MKILFCTKRSLPFEEGVKKYQYAILTEESTGEEITVYDDFPSEDAKIPTWGGAVYEEDLEEIEKIAEKESVKIIITVGQKQFKKLLKDDFAQGKIPKAFMTVTKSQHFLYYTVVGENDCALLIAEE